MRTLSLLWWFVLGGLGLFFPFYTLYLRENGGLTGTEVGLVAATVPLVGLLVQPLWGHLADRTGLRGRVVCVLALGTCLGYASLAWASGFWGFMLCTAALSLFYPALIPACMSASLAALPDPDRTDLGRVRVMGTLGFGASVASFPYLLEWMRGWVPDLAHSEGSAGGAEPGLQLIFFLAAALLLAASFVSLALPAHGAMSVRARRGEWRLLVRERAFVRLVVFVFFIYLTIQGPMVLFPLLVREQGGGIEAISRMWLLMLALEVPLVFYLGAGLSRIGPRGLIAIGIAAAGIRWTVSGFAEDMTWIYLAQLLHGVTVWGVILGAPIYVDAVVPERLRSTGQAWLAMAGVGLGSTLSNVCAGWLTQVANARTPSQVGGILAILLLAALPFVLPPIDERISSDSASET